MKNIECNGDSMFFHYLFFIGSIGGFLLELFYRKLVLKKWIKPGVFRGFYLPLYGIGLVICYTCYLLPLNIIFRIILVVILLTFIELICGIIFIKKLKILLWDYSKNYFNYKGLICMKFSFYWLLLALISFIIFKNLVVSIDVTTSVFIVLFEVILLIDVIVFVIETAYKNKKKRLPLDL